jgi:hypothetical protein
LSLKKKKKTYLFGNLQAAHPADHGGDGGDGEVGSAGYLRLSLLDPHHHHNIKSCDKEYIGG